MKTEGNNIAVDPVITFLHAAGEQAGWHSPPFKAIARREQLGSEATGAGAIALKGGERLPLKKCLGTRACARVICAKNALQELLLH